MHTILLIQPPSTLQKLQKFKSRRPEIEAPLPFVYIAPYLIDAGFDVRFLDLRIDDLGILGRTLAETRPLIAGVSVMPGSMLLDAIRVSQLVKRVSPCTRVVWGGTFPSLHHELCLQVRELDVVVCGDGEETLTDLAATLRENPDAVPARVDGLAYRENGSVRTTNPRQPVDLDRHPVGAWQILDRYISHYLGPSRLLSINTARGCPYQCTFCYNTAIYRGFNRYRTRSIEATLAEVRHLVARYDPRALIFMDDDFLANRKRGADLLGRIHAEFPRLRFRIDARTNELNDPEVVGQLAAQGLESAFFGVEGVSSEFLDSIKKGLETDDTVEAARVCSTHGIQGTYSFTCGYPDETYGDLYQRVEMALLLQHLHPGSRSQIEIISPIIGTPLYGELRSRKLIPEGDLERWSRFSDWKCATDKAWIADGQFYEAFQLAFYLAFSSRSGHDGGMRLGPRLASLWSARRLRSGRPRILPEFRAGNYLLKRVIWGGSRARPPAGTAAQGG